MADSPEEMDDANEWADEECFLPSIVIAVMLDDVSILAIVVVVVVLVVEVLEWKNFPRFQILFLRVPLADDAQWSSSNDTECLTIEGADVGDGEAFCLFQRRILNASSII